MTETKQWKDDYDIVQTSKKLSKAIQQATENNMTEEITIYNELTQSIACNTAYLHGLLVALGYNVKNDELLRLFAQKPFEIIRNNLKKHQETSDLLFKGLSD